MTDRARILVVDDEANIRRTLEALLHRAGFDVVTAANGDEAVILFEQHAFALMLVDLKMPGMGGMEVVAVARERQPSIAIIVLTGHGSFDSTSEEAPPEGIFDYLLKTTDPAQVIERVKAGVAAVRREQQQP
ncbi:MAG TPA: response regulator [Roseiflexaceae bacterium]|jgi:DNA-binding NtrC family response regulator|nr:response regulator [Roseiflexaceae bacterium]